MYENEQAAFLRRYGQIAERLYKIALLVTGNRAAAVKAVEHAAAKCYADPQREDFESKILRTLWHECEGAACESGEAYRSTLCEGRGLSDADCPALIAAMSRCDARERMALALLLLIGSTPEEISALLGITKNDADAAVRKLCSEMKLDMAG